MCVIFLNQRQILTKYIFLSTTLTTQGIIILILLTCFELLFYVSIVKKKQLRVSFMPSFYYWSVKNSTAWIERLVLLV